MWSPKLTEAFDYAARLHQKQQRKGTEVPYLAHLLGVASLVLDWGGQEPAVMTALLHDTVEDQGGAETLVEIGRRFGPRVAALVDACTDSLGAPKPPWRARKEQFLLRLPAADPEARLVIGADKLHNLRAIYGDYRLLGSRLWARFKGGREGTLWYYQELTRVFSRLEQQPAARELDETYRGLVELVRAGEGVGQSEG
jgi:(p)ppGpp synthase/HD superfamily hydrolase